MSERKNIDRLFQEKFKDFEAQPAAEVWENIETRLDEKKKRRIVPFWWKFSGVAAVLVVGFLIGKLAYTAENPIQHPVVIDANHSPEKTSPNTISSSTSGIKNTDSSSSMPMTAVVANPSDETLDTKDNNKRNSPTISALNNKVIAHSNTSKSDVTKNKTKSKTHKIYSDTNNTAFQNTTNQEIAVTQNNNTIITDNKTIVLTSEKSSPQINTNRNDKMVDLDALKGTADTDSKIVTPELKVNDTAQTASVVPNALEELLNEKESKTKQQSKESRWQVASNIAPVFLGSVSNGSPVDPMFENNSKSYNTTLSMGVGVSYAVNSKLSVRTGINKMSVDYDTNGIVFFAALQVSEIQNVNLSESGTLIQVEDAGVAGASSGLLPFENTFAQKNEGYINQKIGYYEVPMELTYALLNKKFGVNIIGGVSTFFLNENSISVVSNHMTTSLGKANNLNEVHFSTNLGLGIKYAFMKSFEFHVEPTIKYQLNTFSENAGNFKPYFFGVYSGISYRF